MISEAGRAIKTGGPVFISYRWSDGARLAVDAARRLRAAGVPVWLDRSDLPPGDIDNRLHEALAGGLSGGVLVATSGVKTSRAVLDVEAPELLRLGEDPAFTLVVLNTGSRWRRCRRVVDRGAPSRWYGRDSFPKLTQYSDCADSTR